MVKKTKTKAKKFKARTLKKSTRQTGKTTMSKDKQIKAKAPGKRRSETGKIYYEYRKNRTDVKGRDAPKIKKLSDSEKRLQNFINTIVKEKNKRESLFNKFKPVLKKKTFTELKKCVLTYIEDKKVKINRNSRDKEILKQKLWEEKQINKIERLKKGIVKAKFLSKSAYDSSHRLSKMIPFGQPILIGHHSQRRHERHIDKIHNDMGKAIKFSNKASTLQSRLKSALANNIISSDDPKALEKLQSKLKFLEQRRTDIKEHNKLARKDKNLETFPTHKLTNLGQNIKSVKGRIISLEQKKKAMESLESKEKSKKGLKLVYDDMDNRVKLIFDGKPDSEIRSALKRNGFRWSPKNNAWQRQLNATGIHKARLIYAAFPNIKNEYYY